MILAKLTDIFSPVHLTEVISSKCRFTDVFEHSRPSTENTSYGIHLDPWANSSLV